MSINIPTPTIDRGPDTPQWALRLQVELDNMVLALRSETARLQAENDSLRSELEALESRVAALESP